jgi:type VI secretion system protein ImpA
MPDAELESLLSPLADDAPCGADLEYDPAFLTLQEAAAGKPEQQYGDTLIPAQEPDWRVVHEQALKLAARTRDLRVAAWLARSGARVDGLAGAVRGLQLVHGLVERHWSHVHPQLDAGDNNDPTARMNALSPLVHNGAGLADLRSASLTGKRGALTVRDIELALGHAEPLPGEAVPTEDGVVQGVSAAVTEIPALATQMQDGFNAVQGLAKVLEQKLEPSQTPELAPLKKLMQRVAEAAAKARGETVDPAADGQVRDATAAARHLGAIASREDAIRALDRVAEWIERNEPSNPAPLFIRRSQRLMSKNFIDIIRDLVPDGLNQIEKLAGTSNS